VTAMEASPERDDSRVPLQNLITDLRNGKTRCEHI
jgi:hypothetical protein